MEQSRGNATWSVPAGRWSSSHRAEQVAFLAAVEDAVKAPKEVKTFRLCTDSLSLVTFLKKRRWRTRPRKPDEDMDRPK